MSECIPVKNIESGYDAATLGAMFDAFGDQGQEALGVVVEEVGQGLVGSGGGGGLDDGLQVGRQAVPDGLVDHDVQARAGLVEGRRRQGKRALSGTSRV